MTETWDYLREYVQPMLADVGCVIEIAPHSLATVDLYSKKGEALMPLYTQEGMLQTFCSSEWKKLVIQRYLRSKRYGPSNPVTTWIGFSLDEKHRAKHQSLQWQKLAFPLLFDVPSTRHDCYRIVEAHGFPTPPKSSCIDCPFKTNAAWRRQRDLYPQDHQRAIEIDNELRAYDIANGRSGVYVHRDRIPLSEVDLDKDDKLGKDGGLVADLFECQSGQCFI
jgi:hypothetical protein